MISVCVCVCVCVCVGVCVWVCINVDIGQSDTCENELKVNSERHARDLQGLWSNSSRYVMYLS